jgi:hypothetical protein
MAEVDEALAGALTSDVIAGILEVVPDEWLESDGSALQPAQVRASYGRYLTDRLTAPRPFMEEAARVR